MTRPALDTRRLNINVMRDDFEILKADCIAKGYVNGTGVLFGAYLGAIAKKVKSGRLKLPENNS
jgi:hypothetical protein